MKKAFLVSIFLFSIISFKIFGQTWSSLKRLTWNAGDSDTPAIATDSVSGIHVVWKDFISINYEILYKRSSDGGANWIGLKRLTWNAGWSENPSTATGTGGGIHVVWEDETPGTPEIFYKRSTDSGATWSAIRRLTWNVGFSRFPSIATDSGSGIHLVWQDDTPGNSEIFYKRSSDGGNTWSGLTRLTWNAGNSSVPSIALDSGSGIHMVWYDLTPGNQEIFYKRSTDGGGTWSAPKRLTWNAGWSSYPCIALDSGGGIHVVWNDDTPGNYEIFRKSSTDAGITWSGCIRLTWNGGGSKYPSIATDSGSGINVVWYDDTPGNDEIFYKNSSNSGITWSGIKRLSWNGEGSYYPSIATDSGTGIHVVWRDDSPGNAEIFYKNRK